MPRQDYMRWRKPANRAFVQASIAAFRDEPGEALEQIANLPPYAWEASDYWLDASGLALYFYNLLSETSMTHLAPASSLQRLRSNLRKNRRRTSGLFREFVALNDLFSRHGIEYANLKGFTLCPHACATAELRHQLDLDFLVAPEHLSLARECLEERGYRLSAATDRTWEFKTGNVMHRKRWDNYTLGTYRSVELHFGAFRKIEGHLGKDGRLLRLNDWSWRGKAFPALSPADQLLGQALHLFSHFRNESTRPSWLLEFRRHVRSRQEDVTFWRRLMELGSGHPYAPIAFGLSTLITSKMFGRFAPPVVETWALSNLPQSLQLWAERYGIEAVLADFPGTKLYLLLETELESLEGRRSSAMRERLIPMRRLRPCFTPTAPESISDRLRRYVRTAQFALFRFRFHTTQALRIIVELPSWRRLRSNIPVPIDATDSAVVEMTTCKQVHDNLNAASR